MREESANLIKEESNLFMAFTKDILLQGIHEMNLQDNLWYLNKRASSNMTTKRSFFHSIDENQHGVIRFGDESSVMFEGRGSIVVNYQSSEELKLEGVLNVLSLEVNILSLKQLDYDGFTSTLGGDFLSIFDNKGRKFAKLQKTGGSMYLLKMGVSEFCHITREEEDGVALWHHRLCHQTFHAIDDMRRGDMVIGLSKYHFSDHLCMNCLARKNSRSAFPNISEFRASTKLELIHDDICGLIKPSTLGGRRYYFSNS